MTQLSTLSNSHRPRKKAYRVGRGMGSKCGKTCGRGVKGDKARRGYKNMFGREGGQIPLYKKLPTRGFSNALFKKEYAVINLGMISKMFEDGEEVSLRTMEEKGLAPRRTLAGGLKILANGDLTKKVVIKAQYFSSQAEEKLKKAGVAFEKLNLGL